MSELVKSKPETLVEKVLYLKKLCYKDVQKPTKEDSLNEENSLICLAETMLKTLLNDLNITIDNKNKDNEQKLKLINLYLNTFEQEVLGSKSFEGNNVTIENLILHLDSIITRMEIRTTSWCVIS